jgi:hypothetical protein
MNPAIDCALTSAAEKVLQRPLSGHETLHLLAGFYAGDEGTLRDRVLRALAEGTNVPRSTIECAAAGRVSVGEISGELTQIHNAWRAAA